MLYNINFEKLLCNLTFVVYPIYFKFLHTKCVSMHDSECKTLVFQLCSSLGVNKCLMADVEFINTPFQLLVYKKITKGLNLLLFSLFI